LNWKKWGVITWVFIIFGIPTLILIIYVAYDITTNENTNQLYSVTLDGKTIHSDQGLTSLVFRAINGSQYVEVYGIVNQTPISFTRLVDDGRNVITTDKSFKIKSNSPSTLIEVSINNKGPGLFEGWLVTKDKNNATISIPLKQPSRSAINAYLNF